VYLDKLDGRIDNTFYDRMSAQWRVEQTRLLREIERHTEAGRSAPRTGPQCQPIVRPAGSCRKKRLLNLVLSNCEWHQGEVRVSFRQHFDLIAETAALPRQRKLLEPS
jgi:site-specific DNA recombinase